MQELPDAPKKVEEWARKEYYEQRELLAQGAAYVQGLDTNPLLGSGSPGSEELEQARKDQLDQLRIRREEARLLDRIQDREERRKYAGRLFTLTGLWLVAVLIVVVASGAEWPNPGVSIGMTGESSASIYRKFGGLWILLSAILVFDGLYRRYGYDPATLDEREGLFSRRKPVLSAERCLGHAWRPRVVKAWLVVTGACALLIINGMPLMFPVGAFDLSDQVLLALVTTTTINVLGLFLIVTRYLFPVKKKDEDQGS